MVIMSEWVYGNGKRQRRGRGSLQCVFCQIQPGYCCQQLERVPLQVDNSCSTNSLLCLHTANIERVIFFLFLLNYG